MSEVPMHTCTCFRAPAKGCFLWRATKRLFKIGVVAVVLAIPAGYLGIPALARTSWARGKVEGALARVAGAPVEVQSMSFSWKTGLALADVRCEAPGWSCRIREALVHPRVKALCARSPKLRVTLRGPELAVRGEASALGPVGRLTIETLAIEDGSLTYSGYGCGEPARITNVNSTTVCGTLRCDGVDALIGALWASVDGQPICVTGTVKVRGGDSSLDLTLYGQAPESDALCAQESPHVVLKAQGADVHFKAVLEAARAAAARE